MDPVTQYMEVCKKWTDLQLQVNRDWVEALKKNESLETDLMWEETLDAFQTSIQGTLDAEVSVSKIWFEEVASVPGIPEQITGLVQPMHGVTKQIIGMQQAFTDSWFKLLRQISVPKLSTYVAKGGPVVITTKA